jgi:hypothetical protein
LAWSAVVWCVCCTYTPTAECTYRLGESEAVAARQDAVARGI